MLGPVEVIGDGAAVALGGPKQRALLAELLLSRGAAVQRERLVDVLWGDSPPASALNSLQIYVHGLRRAVGAERLETRGTAYRVRVDPDELDVVRFERLLTRARQAIADGAPGEADELLDSALSLWRGDALADLGDSPVRAAASGLEELRRQALELRVDARLALGEHEKVIAELEELIAAEPYRERLREQLVLALYRAGRQQDALAAYQDARRRLSDDLGIEPGPALRELERAVLRHDPALAGEQRAEAARPSLPLAATPLVGRRLEVAALEALFRREGVRLVTLTGPGGTGKTRLALAAAAQLAETSRSGAAFVDLSSIREAELVATAIAQALGFDDPHQVETRLRDSSLLLVLDNLEQIAADAAPLVARLLEHAPRLRILATSRVPLRVRGEQEYPVPPLPVAAPTRSFAELVASEAIALFAERAAAVDPEFTLDAATAPLVARICARLDGLPLAIELAAAQVRVLSPAALERRLQRAVDVLVDGARDLPPRQRTLRATLDWSFELLDQSAQTLLPRLAVFAGGFTLDSLEAVAGDGAATALAALVEASLVRRRGERFHVLETIREYAHARLGDETATRAAHAEHFRLLAEEAYADILAAGERERRGLAVLDREADNLRAALAFAVETDDAETQVRLAEAQRWFWLVRGRIEEGRVAFETAVGGDLDPLLRAKALNGAGTFASKQGDTARAREVWQEALEIYREHQVDGEAARCVAELGSVAVAEGDLAEAFRLYETTAELFHALGQSVREGIALSNLSAIASMMDDLDTAIAYGERAIAVQREIEDLPSLAMSLANLAPTLFRLGDVARGRELLREALKLGEDYDYTLLLTHMLAVVAELAALDGRPELAVRLIGAAEGAFAAIGAEVPEGERQAFVRTLELLGDSLPDDVEALRSEGRALSIDAALDEARPLLA